VTDERIDPERSPRSAAALLRAMFSEQAVFFGFFGFLLVALNCILDPEVYDLSLLPRLLALLVFLTVALPLAALPAVSRRLDASLLREPVVLCFAAYALVTCLSLAVAVNVTAGFTDVFKTIASLLVLVLSCLILEIVSGWQERLTKIVSVAALIAGGAGLYQLVSQHGFGLHDRRAMESVMGLMSNVNVYAGFLNLLLPLCLCGVVILRGPWRFVAGLAALLLAVMVVLLQSRAAYVGLAAGVAAAVAAAVFRADRLGLSPRVRGALATAFVGGLCAVAGFVVTAGNDHPLAARLRSIVVEPDNPAAGPREGGRRMIWGITSRMIQDHPFAGVGAGNFTIRVHEYYGADDLDFSNVHTNWVQPHNDFLWVLSEKGVFGLLAFAGIFWFGFSSIRTILRGTPSTTDAWLTVFALMGLVAYVVGSCFDFPLERIDHQVYLAVILAIVTVIRRSLDGVAVAADGGRDWRPLPAAVFRYVLPPILVVLGLGIAYSLAGIRQEKFMILSRRALRDQDWQAAVDNARRAATPWKTLDPLVTPIAFLEGMGHMRLGRLPEATACLERARGQNPNRMYIVNNLGILYAAGGQFEKAIECFERAVQQYPDRLECFNNLAGCYIDTGRFEEAVALLEQIPEPLRSEAIRSNLAAAREELAARQRQEGPPAAPPDPSDSPRP
jgi:O-antigen ligase